MASLRVFSFARFVQSLSHYGVEGKAGDISLREAGGLDEAEAHEPISFCLGPFVVVINGKGKGGGVLIPDGGEG